MNYRWPFSILLVLLGSAAAQEKFTPRPWIEYKTIMWIGDSAWKKPDKTPLFFQRLREMGINTAMVHGDGNLKPLIDNKFPYYVENMVNKGLCLKWSSKVQDWDAMVTGWAKSGRPASAFVRDYCLDDPQWRSWANREMASLVKKNAPHQPLLYDIRDELSTTMSANPFDYDFSPAALASFRTWLKARYRSLEKLNDQWETTFANWDAVMPFSTDQIKHRMSGGGAMPRGKPDWQAVQATKFDMDKALADRTRWNFAPWCDFRTYMDTSLAGTLDKLRQTAHRLDPHTPVGIEGTQMPHAFGGYDLWRLSQALDWVEPYDICNAREIFGSFMPDKPILTTVGETNARSAQRRLWHLLLEGDKGCIVWWSEDCIDYGSDDYALTGRAKALGGVLRQMTSPLAAPLLRARRVLDPVYLLYSQPSIQVGWLLESTVDGSTWHRRFSSHEASHNRGAQVRDGWLKGLQDLGFSAQFLSTAQLTDGWKSAAGTVLVMPQCLALSDAEISAIKAAQGRGVVVLTNGQPGVFDEHGTLRAAPPLPTPGVSLEQACVLGGSKVFAGRVGDYGRDRLKGAGAEFSAWLPQPKKTSGIPVAQRVRIYRYELGKARLVAFERGISYSMSESLSQAGGNEPLEKPVDITANLPAGEAYDLRTGKHLGSGKVQFTLDPWEPTLVAVFPERVADPLKEL